MRTLTRAFSILAAATLTAAVAGKDASDASFAALDRNGDGLLVQDELPDSHDLATDLFAAFDTDNDRRITPAEYRLYASNADRAENESAEIQGDE